MHLPIGIAQIAQIAAAVFCIIELGLAGYVASAYLWRSPDVVNFIVFNSVWSLLILAYLGLAPIFMARLFHQLVSLGLLAVTTIFWFAGAIAIASWTGTPRCTSDWYSWCASAQAASAFAFFIWAIFAGLLVLDILTVMRSRNNSASHPKPGHGNGATYEGA